MLLPEEVGFLRYLKHAKVPLNEFAFPQNKLANIQSQLEKLIEKNYYLHKSAREVNIHTSVHTYIHNKQTNKQTTNKHKKQQTTIIIIYIYIYIYMHNLTTPNNIITNKYHNR